MPASTVIQKSVVIAAPKARVWAVLTTPRYVVRWMADAEIEIESGWVTGSPFIVRGRLNGKYEYRGNIQEMVAEKVFRYTSWSRIMRLEDRPENYASIEFTLRTKGNRTELTVCHNNLISEAAPEHANFYWNGTLGKIRRLAENKALD